MALYTLKRFGVAILVTLAVSLVTFSLLYVSGDPAAAMAGESATEEDIEYVRKHYGFDQPLPVQLAVYLKNVLSLDLGYSFRHDMPVAKLIIDRFWPTLLLMVSTIVLAVGFGIILGLRGLFLSLGI
mgnify:CR=1 FL=1